MAVQPGVGDVHARKTLSNVSVAYKNALYIADSVVPMVFSDRQSDQYATYDKSFWGRSVAKDLGVLEPPPIGGYQIGRETFTCVESGVGDIIPDALVENQDPPFDVLADSAEWVTDQLLLARELKFLSTYWATSIWGTDKVGTTDFTKWSTYATSTPIQDMRAYKRLVKIALMGREPNLLILGDLTFDVLADHPNLLDRIKHSSSSSDPARVTPNLIAQLLGFDRVQVGSVVYTTDPEGTAEASVTYTTGYDDDALMVFSAPRPSRKLPSAWYNFVWRSVYGTDRYVRQRREPMSDKGWLIEGFTYYVMKVIATDAGLFMSDAVD